MQVGPECVRNRGEMRAEVQIGDVRDCLHALQTVEAFARGRST